MATSDHADQYHIIRTNQPDEPDEFAAIGPGGLRDDGFTSTDSALRQALHHANHALSTSSTRLFEAQALVLKYGEALEQLAQWDWRTCEERDPANGPCHCSDCRTVAIARAALENRP